MINKKRHKLLDVDKKNEEVQVLIGATKQWVPFEKVFLEKVSLVAVGKNHIRVTRKGGPKKPKQSTELDQPHAP